MCVHCYVGQEFLKARTLEYHGRELRYIGQVPSNEVQENYRAGYARYPVFKNHSVTFVEGEGVRLLTQAELEDEIVWAAKCMLDSNVVANMLAPDLPATVDAALLEIGDAEAKDSKLALSNGAALLVAIMGFAIGSAYSLMSRFLFG